MKMIFRKFLMTALGGLILLNVTVEAAPKKILVITQSAGFRHQPVNRKGQETCQVERVLAENPAGPTLTACADGRGDPDRSGPVAGAVAGHAGSRGGSDRDDAGPDVEFRRR